MGSVEGVLETLEQGQFAALLEVQFLGYVVDDSCLFEDRWRGPAGHLYLVLSLSGAGPAQGFSNSLLVDAVRDLVFLEEADYFFEGIFHGDPADRRYQLVLGDLDAHGGELYLGVQVFIGFQITAAALLAARPPLTPARPAGGRGRCRWFSGHRLFLIDVLEKIGEFVLFQGFFLVESGAFLFQEGFQVAQQIAVVFSGIFRGNLHLFWSLFSHVNRILSAGCGGKI